MVYPLDTGPSRPGHLVKTTSPWVHSQVAQDSWFITRALRHGLKSPGMPARNHGTSEQGPIRPGPLVDHGPSDPDPSHIGQLVDTAGPQTQARVMQES